MTSTTTTATTTFTAPATRTPAAPSSTKTLWKTGVVSGVAASVATAAFAGIASAADVSLKVGGKAIPAIGFGQVTFVAALIGTIMAVVLSHRASRPRHTFLVTTLALTFVSFVPDVLADAHTATKVTLALSHVVAAAILIPALASRLSD